MKKILYQWLSALTLCLTMAANGAYFQVENAAGKQAVPKNPQRIVTLDFAAADTLRALGEANKIVGFPKGGSVPAYLSGFSTNQFQNVGTLHEPAFEIINELAPDLIVLSPRQQKILEKFKEIAPVFFAQTDYRNYYPSFEQNILAFGKILNKEDLAKQKLNALNEKVRQLAERVKGKTALLILVNESRISVFGDNSRYALLYQKFGFTPTDKNIKSSTHGMSVGFEYLVEQNPDYLFVVDRTAAITDKVDNAQHVLDNTLIRQTDAYKNNRIVYLNAANWYLAFGGLQSMEMMAQEIESAVEK
ncbi:siderophore ABC transporter substrate-binding protein [Rodentibacter caecimuris]|uniref:ABC transporter n=1 Tax=Rodentibacter caecimuris TaxID=1796644 RepID=A0ABX3L0K1_9PAST|nr:ABC transporter [Rodentibacter heylii]